MSNEPAVLLEAVSKTYRHYCRPFDRLTELLSGRRLHQERHSVLDVSLKIVRGEVVGLIGPNGAGKSTLLKMIAGKLEPTTGRIRVNGSVAAILELGTGFHPDLSGRENVRVGGLCLGLTRRQIEREMDNIIAFSELEEVIDMPFRTYSSGMQARLTFATAVSVDPDILIIDEALSVGDNRYQLKSFDRIQEFRRAGKTILLVTHSMGTVASFCDRAILLDRGRIIADGAPARVTSVYHHLQFGELDHGTLESADPQVASNQPFYDPPASPTCITDDAEQIESVTPCLNFIGVPNSNVLPVMSQDSAKRERTSRQGYRYGDRKALIGGVTILDGAGRGPFRQIKSGSAFQFVLDCEAQERIPQLYCGFLVRDSKGDILFGADTSSDPLDNGETLQDLACGERRRVVMRGYMWLAAGDYFVSAAVTTERGRQSDMWFDAFEFRVVGTDNQHTNSKVNLQPVFKMLPIVVTDEAGSGETA
jgi:lipopolysaccharide transport system ATP-binding protein